LQVVDDDQRWPLALGRLHLQGQRPHVATREACAADDVQPRALQAFHGRQDLLHLARVERTRDQPLLGDVGQQRHQPHCKVHLGQFHADEDHRAMVLAYVQR
jgi:hypothetical protein